MCLGLYSLHTHKKKINLIRIKYVRLARPFSYMSMNMYINFVNLCFFSSSILLCVYVCHIYFFPLVSIYPSGCISRSLHMFDAFYLNRCVNQNRRYVENEKIMAASGNELTQDDSLTWMWWWTECKNLNDADSNQSNASSQEKITINFARDTLTLSRFNDHFLSIYYFVHWTDFLFVLPFIDFKRIDYAILFRLCFNFLCLIYQHNYWCGCRLDTLLEYMKYINIDVLYDKSSLNSHFSCVCTFYLYLFFALSRHSTFMHVYIFHFILNHFTNSHIVLFLFFFIVLTVVEEN